MRGAQNPKRTPITQHQHEKPEKRGNFTAVFKQWGLKRFFFSVATSLTFG